MDYPYEEQTPIEILKQRCIDKLDRDVKEYINSKYPLEWRDKFGQLRSDARADGLVNRVNYIDQMLNWADSIFMWNLTKLPEIEACETVEQIRALDLNVEYNSPTDPEIKIEGCFGIND